MLWRAYSPWCQLKSQTMRERSPPLPHPPDARPLVLTNVWDFPVFASTPLVGNTEIDSPRSNPDLTMLRSQLREPFRSRDVGVVSGSQLPFCARKSRTDGPPKPILR
jgi:hypothetical protein